MIKRLTGWLILAPLSLVLIVFALANRQMVEVRFDPFSSTSPLVAPVEVPMFVVIYVVLLFGVILGGVATWFTQGRQRREKRQWRREAKKLEQEQKAQGSPQAGNAGSASGGTQLFDAS